MDYGFNAVISTNQIVAWIRKWFRINGEDCNAIVGISGGKDSSVVAALCVTALGKDRVIGVMMPDGSQYDIGDSIYLCRYLGIKNITVNIDKSVQGIIDAIGVGLNTNRNNILLNKFLHDGHGTGNIDFEFLISEQTKINLPARVRMATLYAISQSNNGRVANTCNLSEDWIGYSTRYGDSVGDFSPLANFTSDEVIKIGDYLGLPTELTHKTPSDGLCGMTDEDNLGFTYAELNKYIRTGEIESKTTKHKIDRMHLDNMFKMQMMESYKNNLPIVADEIIVPDKMINRAEWSNRSRW